MQDVNRRRGTGYDSMAMLEKAAAAHVSIQAMLKKNSDVVMRLQAESLTLCGQKTTKNMFCGVCPLCTRHPALRKDGALDATGEPCDVLSQEAGKQLRFSDPLCFEASPKYNEDQSIVVVHDPRTGRVEAIAISQLTPFSIDKCNDACGDRVVDPQPESILNLCCSR